MRRRRTTQSGLSHQPAAPHDARAAAAPVSRHDRWIELQHAIGNQAVIRALQSPGRPLDPATRAYFEPRFGHDLSTVRVHTGAVAAESADSLNANAYTVGRDVVFGANQFASATPEGRRLLAHELAHTIQQRGPGAGPRHDPPSPARAEREAEAAERAAPSDPIRVVHTSAPGSIQCSPREKGVGDKEVIVEVPWEDDSWDFEDRVVSAVARSRGFRPVPHDSLPFALNRPAADLHSTLVPKHFKRGHRIRIRVSAYYNPDNTPELSHVDVALSEPEPPAPAAKTVQTPAHTPPPHSGPPTLKDQQATVTRILSQMASDADREGFAGFSFTVTNNGRAISPDMMRKLEPQGPRPAGIGILSADSAATDLRVFMDFVTESKGTWHGVFMRDPKSGAMHFQRWRKKPDQPPPPPAAPPPQRRSLSVAEQFEQQTGMIYPQRHNARLYQVGAAGLRQANPFSLRNLPYTIAGAVIPIGAMKLLTMDADQLTNLVRFEWQLDEDLIEGAESQSVRTPRSTGEPPAEPPPTQELKVGDIIPTPEGNQRVVKIESGKITTERPIETTPEPTPAPKPTEAEAVPEPISDEAPTGPLRPGEDLGGEIIGDYRISGTKGLQGDTFEREIWGIRDLRPKPPNPPIETARIRQLFQDFMREARAAGATQLRVTANAVRNPNVLKLQRFIEIELGGTVRTTGSIATMDAWAEFIIPL